MIEEQKQRLDKRKEADKQKAENAKRQAEKEQAYKRFAKTGDGKIIMADLESFCCFRRPSYNEQNPNALQTHINEGKRRVYLRFDGFINKTEKENESS